MKKWALLGVLAFSGSSFAGEVNLKLINSGAVGTAKALSQILPNGQLLTRLTLTMTPKDSKDTIVLIQESKFDKDGKPLFKSQKTSLKTGKLVQFINVVFGPKEVQITVNNDGQRRQLKAAIPKESIAGIPEFWFIRDKPKSGDQRTYQRFDLGKLAWAKTTVKYLGKVAIRVNGMAVQAHRVSSNGAELFLDDFGDPIQLQSGSMTLVRVPK